MRETFIALLIAYFFQFCGELFLKVLHVKIYSVSLCGGTILFLSALQMLFSRHEKEVDPVRGEAEPFIVPIATPFFAGGGLLSIILLYAQELPAASLSLAIALAWVGVFVVMFLATYVQKALGTRGFKVIEQIMGMITLMLSVDLLVSGFGRFVQSL
jgi:multiple antibiotic resistance protein